MAYDRLKLYESGIYLDARQAPAGDALERFRILSGSRIVVTYEVKDLGTASEVQFSLKNTFSEDSPYLEVDSAALNAPGRVQRVVSDFTQLFEISATVVGGQAQYVVGISVFDNAGLTRIENAQIAVDLSDITDSEGHFDSVRVGDGTGTYLKINPDGSISVVLIPDGSAEPINVYGESTGVLQGVETTLVTYTVPVGKIAYLHRVECSGENIARYQITLNAVVFATRRTHHGSGLTTDFEFTGPDSGSCVLQPGDTVEVLTLHNRPFSGDFEARAQFLLRDAP